MQTLQSSQVGHPRAILAAPPPTRPRKFHTAAVPSCVAPAPAHPPAKPHSLSTEDGRADRFRSGRQYVQGVRG